MSILHLSDVYITDALSKYYNLDYFINGQVGLARFIIDHIVNQNGKYIYKCTNLAQKIFKYRDINDKVTHDPNAQLLIIKITDNIMTQVKALSNPDIIYSDNVLQINNHSTTKKEYNKAILELRDIRDQNKRKKFINYMATQLHGVRATHPITKKISDTEYGEQFNNLIIKSDDDDSTEAGQVDQVAPNKCCIS